MPDVDTRTAALEELHRVTGLPIHAILAADAGTGVQLDSLQLFEVLGRLEDRLDVRLDFQRIAHVRTLDDLVIALDQAEPR